MIDARKRNAWCIVISIQRVSTTKRLVSKRCYERVAEALCRSVHNNHARMRGHASMSCA